MSNPLTTFIFEGASIRVFGDSVFPCLLLLISACAELNQSINGHCFFGTV